MIIEFDPVKERKNVEKHGLSFADVAFLAWEDAIIIEDTRIDYGETRMAAFLYGGNELYNVIYTERGNVRRIISFRRAREKERKHHDLRN